MNTFIYLRYVAVDSMLNGELIPNLELALA